MRFASLGSGSRGNSTLVDSGKTSLMIDCGFSRREVERRLSDLDFLAERLDAILVTHEHSDHISGVVSLAEKFDLAVYATHGTVRASSLSSVSRLVRFNAGEQFLVGDILVKSLFRLALEPLNLLVSEPESDVPPILTNLPSWKAAGMTAG